jgi:adhesin HecA-like repeat protein
MGSQAGSCNGTTPHAPRAVLVLLLTAFACLIAGPTSSASAAACSGSTTALTYGASPTSGSLLANATDCYSFAATAGDRIRTRLVETGGGTIQQEIVRPNGTTICTDSTATDQTCLVDTTGTYTVKVTAYSPPATATYVVSAQRLNNPTTCPSLTIGAAPATRTFAVGQMYCLGTGGLAGDQLRIRVIRTAGAMSDTGEVINANGTTKCTFSSGDSTCQLTGGSRLILRDSGGQNTGDLAISIQRLNNPSSCTGLPAGDPPTTDNLVVGGMHCFYFTATAGDRYRLKLAEIGGAITTNADIVGPDGTQLCNETTSSEISCAVDTSGQQRIIVRDYSGTNPGSYNLALRKLNVATGCTSLNFGDAPIAGSLTSAAQMNCYNFAANAGNRVRVRIIQTGGTASLYDEFVRSSGTTLCGPNAGQELSCTIDTTGGTRLIVRDSANQPTASYLISVQRLSNPVGCTNLTPGSAPTSATPATGAVDCYRFTASAGDRWRVHVVETAGSFTANQELDGPTGAYVTSTTSPDLTTRIPSSGTQTVQVHDYSGLNSGSYTIYVQRLNQPSGCTALAIGANPVSGSVAAGGVNCYTFSGTSGDVIRMRTIRTAGTANFNQNLIEPDGDDLCASTSQEVTCSLSTSGTYTMLVNDTAALTGNYNTSIQRLNGPVGCTAVSSGASPTGIGLGIVGATKCLTFSGTAGDRWRSRIVETTGTLIAYQEIMAPDGSTECGPTTSVDQTCQLAQTGIYTVIVRDYSGGNTGNFSAAVRRLNSTTSCTALTVGGDPVSGSVAATAQINCYTFSGSAGDRMRIRLIQTTGGSGTPTSELLLANGSTECGPTSGQEYTCLLDDTGTLNLLIADSSGSSKPNYVISVQRLNTPINCSALTLGGSAFSGVLTTGDMDCFRFTATAGQTVTVHVTETTSGLIAYQEVLRNNGTTLCSTTTAEFYSCTVGTAGTYTVIVRDYSGATTGNFQISVADGGT